MRVALIGGTRFIGRAILRELTENGHDVLLVHRGNTEPDDLPKAEHLHVDRNELGTKKDEIAAFRPDVVCDNIAISRADAETVVGTIEARYVVISSMDVYRAYGSLHAGTQTDALPVDETSPVREERYPYRGQIPGMDDYEKLDVEQVYLERGGTVLRLPMVYGPRDLQRREEFVLRRVRAGRKKIPIGAGTWLGTKGFVDDVGRGVRLAVESDAHGEIFNLGESRTHPIGLWARMILEAAGANAEFVRVPDDQLPEDLGITGAVPQHLLVDSAKARRVLGWNDTDHKHALNASVEWHLANPPQAEDPGFDADDEALAAAAG
jgi:nucleoside-diphosphate-sugar epimerase